MPKRRSLVSVAAGLVAIVAIVVTSTPAQATDYRQINIWHSSHCLDNATQDDLRLQMWSCTGGSEQRWLHEYNSYSHVFTIINQRTGRCIAAPEIGSGTVFMRHCDAAQPTQQWRIYSADDPSGTGSDWYDVWQNMANGFCLTTPSVANGTQIQAITCDPDDPYDRWHEQ